MSSHSIPTQADPEHPKQQQEHQQSLKQVVKYHHQTKHAVNAYARGPHGLDWANQPNPFRSFVSAPLLPLPQTLTSTPTTDPSYSSLFLSLPPPSPLSAATLSHLLYHSLALSAWKSAASSTWSLRVNPSSGNLHPTEAYVIAPPLPPLSPSPFVAHYAPKHHSLHLRSSFPSAAVPFLPAHSLLVGFSSIFWREAWKYGERALRYCNHDVGHALAAVTMAAAGLGWDAKLLDGLGFGDLEKLMGLECQRGFQIPSRLVKGRLPEIELEHPDCVIAVFPNGAACEFNMNYRELSSAISEFSKLEWEGRPSSLSKEHVCWDIIYRTAEAAKKPLTVESRVCIEPFQGSGLYSESSYKGLTLRQVVRKRRSAVDMDGVHVMSRDTFYQILLHCLPSGTQNGGKQGKQLALPFRVLSWEAEVHAALFVHRVADLPKGLYFLVRNEGHFADLRKAMSVDFKWAKPEGCPDELPLYELSRGDCQQLAKLISCHQDIAGDGCFSLGMLARFEPTLREKGAWMYPRLFWETGVLGQVLYLEAHAVGISATGIGCFFDDAVHELLGLKGSDFQSLYHFTVGGPVVDKRIMSLPAYPGPGVDQ